MTGATGRRACATSPTKTGRTIVVTLGGDGVLAATPNDFLTVPALKITPVDTVGAGDTFCGYFAAGLSSGLSLEQALARAGAAGSLACLKPGAQPAIPLAKRVDHDPGERSPMNSMRPNTKHAVPPAGDICRLSAVELADAIRRSSLSVREVVTAFLDRIEAVNPLVNAIVSLRDRADILREADAADSPAGAGRETGSLFGLPIAIKDLALTKGLQDHLRLADLRRFRAATRTISSSSASATAGAIIIGKTNVPEFGLGSNTYNTVFGPTLNAFDPALTAGGSSGGAAVALALDMVPVADGSDFGGSLRNPAAWNNVYGFRPSQGLVPGGPDFEVFHAQMGVEGPMGRNVADMALLLDVQAGYHPHAPLSL